MCHGQGNGNQTGILIGLYIDQGRWQAVGLQLTQVSQGSDGAYQQAEAVLRDRVASVHSLVKPPEPEQMSTRRGGQGCRSTGEGEGTLGVQREGLPGPNASWQVLRP